MQATVQPEISSSRFLVRCCSLCLSLGPPGFVFRTERKCRKATCMLAASPRGVAGDPRCVVSVGAVSWLDFAPLPALPFPGTRCAVSSKQESSPSVHPSSFVKLVGSYPGFARLPARILAFLVLRANGLFSQNTNPHFVRYDLPFRTRPCSPRKSPLRLE